VKNTKKLLNWCNFFIIEDFFTKDFLHKTTRLSKLVEESVEEKSPEQELEELKNKELELKEQIKQPDSLLRDMYSSNSPKKDVIVEWAGNLERQYELEVKLHRAPVVESIGAISSYIKLELKSLGVHQSTYSYVHEVLGYKYKNEKYNRTLNQDDDDGAVQQRQDSSNTIADFEKQNAPLIETFEQQRELLKSFINKAKSCKILSELNSMQLLQYEETNLRMQATQSFAFQVIDDRQSVPVLAQLKLVMAIVASTNNSAAGMYVSQVKQYGANKKQEGDEFFNRISAMIFSVLPDKYRKLFLETIKSIKKLKSIMKKIIEKQKIKQLSRKSLEDVMTSKQAMKIIFGAVKNVLPVFDHTELRGHHDRDAAIMDGYYGISCPECGSFRVREREHPDAHEWLCFCYKCEWWFEAKTISKCWNCHIPLFEELLEIILKTAKLLKNPDGKPIGAMESKCPRCEKELILPAKMFQRTKLRGK